MESILFVSRSEFSDTELIREVSLLGGNWNNDPTLNHGVIKSGDAIVFVNKKRQPSTEYDVDALAKLMNILGGSPATLVCIDIGHADGSNDLARFIGEHFRERWGGMIDGNEVMESIPPVELR